MKGQLLPSSRCIAILFWRKKLRSSEIYIRNMSQAWGKSTMSRVVQLYSSILQTKVFGKVPVFFMPSWSNKKAVASRISYLGQATLPRQWSDRYPCEPGIATSHSEGNHANLRTIFVSIFLFFFPRKMRWKHLPKNNKIQKTPGKPKDLFSIHSWNMFQVKMVFV